MSSLPLRIAAFPLMRLQIVLSFYFLARGHNQPGGGFIGGLLIASGFALVAMAYDVARAREVMRISPTTVTGIGLLTAILSGVAPLLENDPYMDGSWTRPLSAIGLKDFALGTPILFDVGVYLTVWGASTTMIFLLFREQEV